MICRKCKNAIPDGLYSCPNCGTSLSVTELKEREKNILNAASNPFVNKIRFHHMQESYQPEKQKKDLSWIPSIVIVLILIALVIFAMVKFFG